MEGNSTVIFPDDGLGVIFICSSWINEVPVKINSVQVSKLQPFHFPLQDNNIQTLWEQSTVDVLRTVVESQYLQR
jgi:hypothetical protein